MLASGFYMAILKDFFRKELGYWVDHRIDWVLRVYLDVGLEGVMTQHYLLIHFQNLFLKSQVHNIVSPR